MKVNNFKDLDKNYNYVITIGTFDGVHLGHLKIIDTLIAESKKRKSKSLLIAFNNSPREIVKNKKVLKITNKYEKARILESLDVDYYCLIDFTKEIMGMDKNEFLNYINVNINAIVVGEDFNFGNQKIDKMINSTISIVKTESLIYNKHVIGSTRIRDSLKKGDIKLSNSMLGREYFIINKVVKGNKIGRKMGIPTANINIPNDKAIPLEGVYITRTSIDGLFFNSVTSIGSAPTVGRKFSNIETYIIDFDKDIYAEEIEVHFFEFLRENKKFENIYQLQKQILDDIKNTKEYFK